MEPDLELELLRRNARFRAWRAYGVPVEVRWEVAPERWRPPRTLLLHIACTAGCRLPRYPYAVYSLGWVYSGADSFAQTERSVLSARQGDRFCPHIAPLFGEDPPEVQALIELELLAGG
jgi:hypothetical protein